jgi:hypothetical protein
VVAIIAPYTDARDPTVGALLVPLVGVPDSPFQIRDRGNDHPSRGVLAFQGFDELTQVNAAPKGAVLPSTNHRFRWELNGPVPRWGGTRYGQSGLFFG